MAKKFEEVVVMDEFGDFDVYEEIEKEDFKEESEEDLLNFNVMPSNIKLDDHVTALLKEIGETRLLTSEEEVELSNIIQKGLLAEKELEQGSSNPILEQEVKAGKKAQTKLVEHNYRLVFSVVKKYTKFIKKTGFDIMDLFQEGCEGAQHATIKFDPSKGKFSTIATWWIRNSITRFIDVNKGAVKIPSHINEKHTKLIKAEAELTQELGRTPNNFEISQRMGVDEKEVTSLKEWFQQSQSLDTTVGDDEDATLQNIIPDTSYNPLEALEREKALEEIEKQINNLPEEEKMVMKHILGLGVEKKNLEEIAKLNQKSSERIRQIKESAKKKLQKQLDPAIIAMIFGRK